MLQIGTAHVRVRPDWRTGPCAVDGHPLQGRDGAFVRAVADATSELEFEALVRAECQDIGLDLIELTSVEAFSEEMVDDIDPVLAYWLDYLDSSMRVAWATFECYMDESTGA